MTSQIVRTNPTAGTATTSSVRNNFGFAADEINRLLRANTDKVVATGTNSIVANFSNVPTFGLDDGVRVLIQIANTTTNGTPTLNVNSSGNVTIKKSDNTDLAIGDLVAGGYYEFVYSSLNNYWLVLNLSAITSQDALLTTILGGLYPVGSLLTTTLATDPGTADYFFSGITFGTWEAYAQGRTIVGIDTGTAITLANSTSNVVTLTVASHSLSAGDLIAVSGFTSDADANGEFTVDSTTSTTIVYTATSVSDGGLTGTDLLVKNAAFDTAQEVGGESNHTLSLDQMPSHRHGGIYPAGGSGGFSQGFDVDNPGSGNSLASEKITAYTGGDKTDGTIGETQPQNNLQPYITTYIWKRTV
jgi:hypothetical protein